jgi:sugar phosphate isomerase/epimerase
MNSATDRSATERRHPFRVGTTSFITPDTMLNNVKALAGRVDDIELLFFDSQSTSDLPGFDEIDQMAEIAANNSLTYTVHLPLDAQLGATCDEDRHESSRDCCRIMSLTASLDPFAYVLHLNKKADQADGDSHGWRDAVTRSLSHIVGSGVDPQRLCIETLFYPFDDVADIVAGLDLSVCLDIGHILLAGHQPLDEMLEVHLQRTRVIHLHGIKDGKDHCDISHLDPEIRSMLFSRLSEDERERVVTLEVFNQADLDRSLSVVKEMCE